MRIISREEWGAQYDNGADDAPLPFDELWLHHSVTAPNNSYASIRHIEQVGESRFGTGISYTWLVTPDGSVYEGHSVNRQGTHTYGRNDRSRAICLVGNYESQYPTAAQITACAWLVWYVRYRGWYSSNGLTGGHRDLKATACPGRNAYQQIPHINDLSRRVNQAMSFTPNEFLMAPCSYRYPSDAAARAAGLPVVNGVQQRTETHPFVEWMAVSCIRQGQIVSLLDKLVTVVEGQQ